MILLSNFLNWGNYIMARRIEFVSTREVMVNMNNDRITLPKGTHLVVTKISDDFYRVVVDHTYGGTGKSFLFALIAREYVKEFVNANAGTPSSADNVKEPQYVNKTGVYQKVEITTITGDTIRYLMHNDIFEALCQVAELRETFIHRYYTGYTHGSVRIITSNILSIQDTYMHVNDAYKSNLIDLKKYLTGNIAVEELHMTGFIKLV